MAPKRSKGGASAASSKRTRTSPAPEEDDDIAMAPDTEDPVSPGTTASHSPDGRRDDEADDSDAADDDDEEFDGATAEAEIRAQMEVRLLVVRAVSRRASADIECAPVLRRRTAPTTMALM